MTVMNHLTEQDTRQSDTTDVLRTVAGNRKYVKKIASLACEKNISGLMIEVHNIPKIALSDKKQQIDIIQFGALCKYLRKST